MVRFEYVSSANQAIGSRLYPARFSALGKKIIIMHAKVSPPLPSDIDQRVLATFNGHPMTIRTISQALGLGNCRNHTGIRAALGRLIEVGQIESVWQHGARSYRRRKIENNGT